MEESAGGHSVRYIMVKVFGENQEHDPLIAGL